MDGYVVIQACFVLRFSTFIKVAVTIPVHRVALRVLALLAHGVLFNDSLSRDCSKNHA